MSGAPGDPALVPNVAVVIPALDAVDVLAEQLGALHAQDAPCLAEVVVVDNGSTDGTPTLVEEYATTWPKLRLIEEQRRGGNAARNAGVRSTTADAVLLCDADDVVGDGWLEALRHALADHDLVRGRYELERLNDPDTIAARGPLASTNAPDPHRPINGLGGNCGFRRSAWHDLGGFDEGHYGSDDDEFFWRADAAGLRIGYVDDAVVHYRLRSTFGGLYRQQRSWSSNRAQLYRQFGRQGYITRRTLTTAAKSWAWAAVHAADAWSADPARRGRWVRVMARNVGAARGSLRHRVVYP